MNDIEPTIFTVNVFNPDRLKNRDIFISSWEDAMPDANIKVYTEKDDIVQEALLLGKKWIDYCSSVGLYNYATNFIRLYILSKMPRHLYFDDDVFVYRDVLDNIDLDCNYVSFRPVTADGILSVIYNGGGINVDNTLKFMNGLAERQTKIYKDFVTQNADDNRLVMKLMLDNSFRAFPQNLFFHYNSLYHCLKTKNVVVKFGNIDINNIDNYKIMYNQDQIIIHIEDNVEPYSEIKQYFISNNIVIIGVYKYNNNTYKHILHFLKSYNI